MYRILPRNIQFDIITKVKSPEKLIRKGGRTKQILENIALTLAAVGAVGYTGSVISNWNENPNAVDNPIPFPSFSQSLDDIRYYELKNYDRVKIWESNHDNLTSVRRDMQAIAQSFLINVIGSTSEGRYNGPSVSRSNLYGGDEDDSSISNTFSYQEDGLTDGSLQGVMFRVTNDDLDYKKKLKLDIIIEGLFMSPHRSRYDLGQSQITELRIIDGEASVYDGKVTIVHFFINPDGGMDVVLLRGKFTDVPDVVFDSRNAEFNLTRSPGETFIWMKTVESILSDFQTYYRLDSKNTSIVPGLNGKSMPKTPVSK